MASTTLNASIHRMLLFRLSVTTVVLCLLFAALSYYSNQRRIEREVVELARLQTTQFARSIRDLLDSRDTLSPDDLGRRLDDFDRINGQALVSNGHFVLVRIYDRNGRQLLDRVDETFEALPVVRQAIDDVTITPLEPDDFEVVSTRLEGQPYVGVALPLNNSAHEAVAHIIGVFAISPSALADIRGDIVQTLLYVAGLIFVTALVIYPIIARLLARLSRQAVRLLDSNLEILGVLGSAIAKRDSDTDAHNYRVTVYSVHLAEAVDLPRGRIRSLIKGALLHDVGKLGIRDDVLLKPDRLNEEEFSIMQSHVEHGLEITERANWLSDARAVVGGHHEKYDGSGYPTGLVADAIPIEARIFAITDVFDALTSRRPYKAPLSFDETIRIMERDSDGHFDPELLGAFIVIARDLYDTYGGKDDDTPKKRLDAMIDQYFKQKIADLFI